MSSGAKQIFYMVPETVAGETPSSPVWATMPFTSATIDANANKTDSDTIKDGRIGSGAKVTGLEVAGELTSNLSYGTFDALLAAAFYNNWASNELTVGTVRKSFTGVRGFTDAGGYHHFRGLHVSQLAITIPEEGYVTAAWTFAGLKRESFTTAPTGTITPASDAEEFTTVDVGEITLDGVTLKGIACVTAFSFNLNNNLQAQKCLGDGLGAGKQIETRAAITGNFTVAWGDKAAEMYEKQFSNGKLALRVPFGDEDGNQYVIELPVVTITGSLPSGSATDLLQTDFEYTVEDVSPKLIRIPAVVGP